MISQLESKLLYKPSKSYTDISLDGYEHRFVTIETTDHVSLSGLLVESSNARYYVLFLGDNTGNLSYQIDRIKLLCDHAFSVLTIDYRGFGRSGGVPSEEGIYEDALSAYRYLVTERQIDSGSVILWGRSLGGAVAVDLATRVPARAVIIESSFTTLNDLQKDRIPIFPLWRILPNRYNSLQKIGHVGTPILFLHGECDSLIDARHSEILFRAATKSCSKQIRVLAGSDHYNTFQNKDYITSVTSFLEGLPCE